MIKILFVTIFVVIVFVAVYGIIDSFNQISKIKDDETEA